jgi:hypothetical protein
MDRVTPKSPGHFLYGQVGVLESEEEGCITMDSGVKLLNEPIDEWYTSEEASYADLQASGGLPEAQPRIWYHCPHCHDEDWHETLGQCSSCKQKISEDVLILIEVLVKSIKTPCFDYTIIFKYLNVEAQYTGERGFQVTGTANSSILKHIFATLSAHKNDHHIDVKVTYL